MSKRFSCTCGAIINAPDSATSIRCPECESVVGLDRPGGLPEDPKRTAPRKKKVDPAKAAEESLRRRQTGPPPPESTFQSVDGLPSTPRRRKRRVEKPATKQEADINPFPIWLRAWIDPALLLWMPLLAPALAFTFGTMLFGLLLRGIGAASMLPAIFGGWLGLMPTSLIVTMWCDILREWAMGADRDPEWPTFDTYEMLRRLAQWVGSGLVAAATGYGVYRGLDWLASKAPAVDALPLETIGIAVACVYFPIALLTVILWDSLLSSHPLAVIAAAWRLRKGAISFWLEYGCHLAVLYAALRIVARIKAASLIDGMAAWIVWWALGLISISRLMRVLGRFYFRNAKSLGWFKVGN